MRIALLLVAIVVIFLGLWLIASGFIDPVPAASGAAQVVAAPRQNANPGVLGVALLVGGVIFLILLGRRR
ncbi:MAG: hypothetical protein ABMA13_15800 [Chthoniobacteraceae bacterium]